MMRVIQKRAPTRCINKLLGISSEAYERKNSPAPSPYVAAESPRSILIECFASAIFVRSRKLIVYTRISSGISFRKIRLFRDERSSGEAVKEPALSDCIKVSSYGFWEPNGVVAAMTPRNGNLSAVRSGGERHLISDL
jgi:hypothetical protein